MYILLKKLTDTTKFLFTLFSYIWWDSELDTPQEKRWTWVLVLLCLWPQYQALKLLKRIFNLRRTGVYRDNTDLKRQTQVI